MDIGKRLHEIWNNDYIAALPSLIRERGYTYADNVKSDILITGINPSFRENDKPGVFHGPINTLLTDDKWDNYFGPIKKMLKDKEIDLREKSDYLDIFYFREKNQNFLKKYILNSQEGIRFVIDQLNLTMHIIEDIVRPKLLIVKNKESWAYFGKLYDEKGWVWMGYKYEYIQSTKCGKLYKITGLLDSNERIAPEINHSNIIGSYVLFSKHINKYTSINERPSPLLLKSILDCYDKENIYDSLACI